MDLQIGLRLCGKEAAWSNAVAAANAVRLVRCPLSTSLLRYGDLSAAFTRPAGLECHVTAAHHRRG
jgi:hypothetical protein